MGAIREGSGLRLEYSYNNRTNGTIFFFLKKKRNGLVIYIRWTVRSVVSTYCSNLYTRNCSTAWPSALFFLLFVYVAAILTIVNYLQEDRLAELATAGAKLPV